MLLSPEKGLTMAVVRRQIKAATYLGESFEASFAVQPKFLTAAP